MHSSSTSEAVPGCPIFGEEEPQIGQSLVQTAGSRVGGRRDNARRNQRSVASLFLGTVEAVGELRRGCRGGVLWAQSGGSVWGHAASIANTDNSTPSNLHTVCISRATLLILIFTLRCRRYIRYTASIDLFVSLTVLYGQTMSFAVGAYRDSRPIVL